MKCTLSEVNVWHLCALRWHGQAFTGRRTGDGSPHKADWARWVADLGTPQPLSWDNPLNVLVGVSFEPADPARFAAADCLIRVDVRGSVTFEGAVIRCQWVLQGDHRPRVELPIETPPDQVRRLALQNAADLAKAHHDYVAGVVHRDRLRLAAAARVIEILAQGGSGLTREDLQPAPVP
jgi:hypothetical protein